VARKKDPRRWLIEALETPEQREERRRREAARKEKRLRRKLAKVGLTLEDFEERRHRFYERFYGDG
jgi:hypothetical protein